jgi:hypothetical protein
MAKAMAHIAVSSRISQVPQVLHEALGLKGCL